VKADETGNEGEVCNGGNGRKGRQDRDGGNSIRDWEAEGEEVIETIEQF